LLLEFPHDLEKEAPASNMISEFEWALLVSNSLEKIRVSAGGGEAQKEMDTT
jgi:hypothetical protein